MNKAVYKLESVKAAFEHWRETRARQGKIPDHLWSQVKEFLGAYSLQHTTDHVYLIVDKGRLAGTGAHSYTAGNVTSGAEEV